MGSPTHGHSPLKMSTPNTSADEAETHSDRAVANSEDHLQHFDERKHPIEDDQSHAERQQDDPQARRPELQNTPPQPNEAGEPSSTRTLDQDRLLETHDEHEAELAAALGRMQHKQMKLLNEGDWEIKSILNNPLDRGTGGGDGDEKWHDMLEDLTMFGQRGLDVKKWRNVDKGS